MNRELKFRAWDGDNMHYNVGVMPNVGQSAEWQSGSDCQYFRPDRYEVMQYTGLEDNNGKEIYEGDIIKAEGIPVKATESGQDSWIEKVFEVPEYTYLGGAYSVCRDVHNIDINDNSSSVEVIGNKFEDPNLL